MGAPAPTYPAGRAGRRGLAPRATPLDQWERAQQGSVVRAAGAENPARAGRPDPRAREAGACYRTGLQRARLTAAARMDSETPTQAPARRYFTWDEVAQRSGREKERWLVIDRKVYNISEFSRRHPGGSRVISHYAGQDATVSAAGPRHGSGRGRAAAAGGPVREAGSLAPRDELTTPSGKSQKGPSIPVGHDLARDARAGE